MPSTAACGNPGGLRPALLIDSSTIDPPTARDMVAAVTASSLHKDARPCHGCSAAHPSLVDAPVSGGITGASKATLTFMVSPVHTSTDLCPTMLQHAGILPTYCNVFVLYCHSPYCRRSGYHLSMPVPQALCPKIRSMSAQDCVREVRCVGLACNVHTFLLNRILNSMLEV